MRARTGCPPPRERDSQTFDVWPLYFSRSTGIPETTYHALLPVGGSMQGRLGYDRLSWVLFPLYVQSEKKGALTTSTPWPFIRVDSWGRARLCDLAALRAGRAAGRVRAPILAVAAGLEQHPQPDPDLPKETGRPGRWGSCLFMPPSTVPRSDWETYFGPFFGYTDRTDSLPPS